LSGCIETFAARLGSSTLETAIESRRGLLSLWPEAGMDQIDREKL
jgi:hypothetical protein